MKVESKFLIKSNKKKNNKIRSKFLSKSKKKSF